MCFWGKGGLQTHKLHSRVGFFGWEGEEAVGFCGGLYAEYI